MDFQSLKQKFLAIPNADKILHFTAGALIAVIVALIFKSPNAGMIAAIVAGIGKEVYDSFHRDKHTVDILDAIATILGGVVVVIILNLIK